MTPQAFILAHGWRARADHLAHVLGVGADDVAQIRGRAPCAKGPRRLFADLFALRHGRPPGDDEWPLPLRRTSGHYEWLPNEFAILGRLVGTLGPADIAAALTDRLRRLTGDPAATRTRGVVVVQTNRIGLQTTDVAGGLTVAQASRETAGRSLIDHEIRVGRIRTFRVGRLVVIPHAEWARWKAGRSQPPKGWWRLAKLKAQLGIKSDKLSEFARDGFIPGAVQVKGYGFGASSRWGTWYIEPKAARKLVADRRAGRRLPWHGAPLASNLRTTWRLLERRRHPEACDTCRTIWGPTGAPTTFDDYARRYPPLAHGAKRHLTRPWSDGLTLEQLANDVGVTHGAVLADVKAGMLRARRLPGVRGWRVTKTDATRWKARRCPSGTSLKSWLALLTARHQYGFTGAELRAHITGGRLRTKQPTSGPGRGRLFVPRQQLVELRKAIGYTEGEAARRVGVSVSRLRVLLRGVNWRGAARIPHDTVDACKKRKYSLAGISLAEAATILGKSMAWIRTEIAAGTIHPLRAKWERRRLYITPAMFDRLIAVALNPRPRTRWSAAWLYLSEAAHHAGVSIATMEKWGAAGEIRARPHPAGMRYHRRSIEARARTYWRDGWGRRFKRAHRPAWLTDTQEAA